MVDESGAGWSPGPRPAWVDAVNRGDIVPITEVARRPFTRDALAAEAHAELGLAGAPLAAELVEPLDVLVAALETEADLTILGRWITRRFLLRLLEVRWQLDAYVAGDPGVRDEDIVEPVFVTGAPRTGTTMLHALLAADERNRVPQGWELLRPLPPPTRDTFGVDGRVALTDDELQMPQRVAPRLLAMHEYGARLPKECLSAMSFALRSEEFISRYRVPSYVAWLQRADVRPAYEMHRLVLQVLQRLLPTRRWVLKSPVHMHALPTLLAVYPDAQVVVTHRDPVTVLASVTSLVATLRWVHSDHVDFAELGAYHADLYCSSLNRLAEQVSDGTLPADRLTHVSYADLARDPVAAVRALYERLGVDVDARLVEQLDARSRERPKDKHGEHRYSFADVGLDLAETRARVAPYQRAFAVVDEPIENS